MPMTMSAAKTMRRCALAAGLALPFVTVLPASAQVPTEVLFFNYSGRNVKMNMGGEVEREVRAGGSDSHTSYFSKSPLGSGERVYHVRFLSTTGATLCDTYFRLQAESTKTISECVVQSQTSAAGVQCSSHAEMESNTKCRAQLDIDD